MKTEISSIGLDTYWAQFDGLLDRVGELASLCFVTATDQTSATSSAPGT